MHRFQTPASATYHFTASPATNADVVVAARTICGDSSTEVICRDDLILGSETFDRSLAIGEVIYLVVEQFDSGTLDFTVTITAQD